MSNPDRTKIWEMVEGVVFFVIAGMLGIAAFISSAEIDICASGLAAAFLAMGLISIFKKPSTF